MGMGRAEERLAREMISRAQLLCVKTKSDE